MADFRGSFDRWWRGFLLGELYPHHVVVSARKTGKSTWFAEKAAESDDVALWRPPMRAPTQDEVWASLFATVGWPFDPSAAVDAQLDERLRDRSRSLVLVVEDWDLAVDGRGAVASDACYSVLDELVRLVQRQATAEPSPSAFLGLVLVAGLPTATDLSTFARSVSRATFQRLSGRIGRDILPVSFPFLTQEDAAAFVRERGVDEEDAVAIARDAGGWLWLLERAASAARLRGSWADVDPITRRAIAVEAFEGVFSPVLASRPDRDHAARGLLDYLGLLLGAEGRRTVTSLGLPVDPADPARLAPLLHAVLDHRVMVVDTENLRMGFDKLQAVSRSRSRGAHPYYRDGVDAVLQPRIRDWMEELRDRFDLPPEAVRFVGRNRKRIDEIVGPATPGVRVLLPGPLQKKEQRAASRYLRMSPAAAAGHTAGPADDMLSLAVLLDELATNPYSQGILVSGDGDIPIIADSLQRADRLWVCTPWHAAPVVRTLLEGTGRLTEHGLPLENPDEIVQRLFPPKPKPGAEPEVPR